MKVGALTAVATVAWVFAIANAEAQSASAAATNPQDLAKIAPGRSEKADVQSALGAPWRVVQFNDCGMAMDDQADETWEYRGADANGGYRIHIEFSDNGIVHLIAKIPDTAPGGQAVGATIAPAHLNHGMSM